MYCLLKEKNLLEKALSDINFFKAIYKNEINKYDIDLVEQNMLLIDKY
jgi:hypothetical protein